VKTDKTAAEAAVPATSQRPIPVGERRGRPYYDTAEVAAYRQQMGVTQAELAANIGVAQPVISMTERALPASPEQAVVADHLFEPDLWARPRRRAQAHGASSSELMGARDPRA
jgi:ribosome-binding protein aMBF1 (putative translation factor)